VHALELVAGIDQEASPQLAQLVILQLGGRLLKERHDEFEWRRVIGPLGQRRQFLRAFRDLDCNVIAMGADVIADEAESLSNGLPASTRTSTARPNASLIHRRPIHVSKSFVVE
jgi:hypothetical protein